MIQVQGVEILGLAVASFVIVTRDHISLEINLEIWDLGFGIQIYRICYFDRVESIQFLLNYSVYIANRVFISSL